MGNDRYTSVADGNRLTSRTLILALVAASLAVFWLLEQPQGFLMEDHILFQDVLRLLDVYRTQFKMRSFGHAADKPTWLYGSSGLSSALRCHVSTPKVQASTFSES